MIVIYLIFSGSTTMQDFIVRCCTTKNYPDVVKEAKKMYLKEGFDRKLQLAGAVLEGMSSMTPPGGREINMKLTRLEEIAIF